MLSDRHLLGSHGAGFRYWAFVCFPKDPTYADDTDVGSHVVCYFYAGAGAETGTHLERGAFSLRLGGSQFCVNPRVGLGAAVIDARRPGDSFRSTICIVDPLH